MTASHGSGTDGGREGDGNGISPITETGLTIEFENFDAGVAGVAYHDIEAANDPKRIAYRKTDVGPHGQSRRRTPCHARRGGEIAHRQLAQSRLRPVCREAGAKKVKATL